MFFRRRKSTENTAAAEYVPHAKRQRIPPKVRFEILRRDNYTCRYCGAKGPQAGGTAILEIDHRVPVARGGTNNMANLWTACWDCNRGKGTTTLDNTEKQGRRTRTQQWETCRIEVQMTGDQHRQAVVIRVDHHGAGRTHAIVKPKEFKFKIALPSDWVRSVSWGQYFLYLSEKEQKAMQRVLDELDKRLMKDGWEQIAPQEYRRRVK